MDLILILVLAGRTREEQVEVCFEGRHDPCEWEGLSLLQVHWVRRGGTCAQSGLTGAVNSSGKRRLVMYRFVAC